MATTTPLPLDRLAHDQRAVIVRIEGDCLGVAACSI